MLNSIISRFDEKIDSAYEVVREYVFALAGESPPNEPFRVKLVRYQNGLFSCRISHFVHRSGLAGPHRVSFGEYKTQEEAFEEAFSHGLMNFDANDTGAKWERNDGF